MAKNDKEGNESIISTLWHLSNDFPPSNYIGKLSKFTLPPIEADSKDDSKDDKEDVGKRNIRSPIKDVDFGMDGKPTYNNPLKKFDKDKAIEDLIGNPRDPSRFETKKNATQKNFENSKTSKTMRHGGLVRGAGCARRGRGRGKMV